MPSFAERSHAFLQEEYAASPVWASYLGLEGYDDQLDDLSAEAFERQAERASTWRHEFAAIPTSALTFEESIDRDLLLSVLRGREIMRDWQMWRRQPDTYLNPGLQGVFTLFLNRLRPEPELVQAAVSRLKQIPRALEQGKQNLRAELTPPVYVERAQRQTRAAVRYARELVPAEAQDESHRQVLADAGAVAAQAFEDFGVFLETLQHQASGPWAIGEDRYSRLLREKEMLPFDARALRERGRVEWDALAESLRRCAQKIAQTDDWAHVLHQLNLDHPRTPDEMRAAYADWTERARQFLKDTQLVTFPEGEVCLVEPSPHFQRPVLAVASYNAPPPFASSMTGHFFVPFPPDGSPEEEIQQRLESNSYPSIPTTAVHEAYPGHHWHLSVSKSNPSAVRRSYRTPYFSEGWALYAERMMREQGFFPDAKAEMGQFEATIFRAARIVVDTSLHMGEMSFEDAVRFMMEKANLPEPTARAEVGRYCSWPTQASAYLTGCLQIVDIRQRYLAASKLTGIDALRAFHDAIARSGGLPLALAERAALRAV